MQTNGRDAGGLAVYLNDHLAGAAAAIQLATRGRARGADGALGRHLEQLLGEIEEDRTTLRGVMARVGVSPNPVKLTGARGIELLTSLMQRVPGIGAGTGPAARLEELEMLGIGIEGERLLWQALGALARSDDRLAGIDFAGLERRARAQRDGLRRFRLELVAEAFAA
jgi:hypothetical protein